MAPQDGAVYIEIMRKKQHILLEMVAGEKVIEIKKHVHGILKIPIEEIRLMRLKKTVDKESMWVGMSDHRTLLESGLNDKNTGPMNPAVIALMILPEDVPSISRMSKPAAPPKPPRDPSVLRAEEEQCSSSKAGASTSESSASTVQSRGRPGPGWTVFGDPIHGQRPRDPPAGARSPPSRKYYLKPKTKK